MRRSHLAPVLSFLLLLAGCGGGDKTTKPVVPSDGLPAGTPAADSPMHLMQRFEATWESEVDAQYALLLTNDFHFTFSAAADPALADQYPNWGRDDEDAAITHMFNGFVNSNGFSIPAVSRIDLTLTGVQQTSDPDHPDSLAHYQKIVVVSLDGTIEIPNPPDQPISYHVISRQEFYLVRGDAAVLPAGATADTSHWYMRRWDDLSAPTAQKGPVINPATPKTLGSIKAMYRI